MKTMTLAALICLTTVPAYAVNEYVPPAEEVKADKDKTKESEQGWHYHLSLGASVAFGANDQVVGQQSGASWTLGFNLNGAVGLLRNKHDWRNTLSILENVTRSPALSEWVKSADTLDFQSIYYLHLAEWIGPFARFSLTTPLFKGREVRATPTDYSVNGTVVASGVTSLKLTDPFQVLTLKESVGVFAQPVSKPSITIDTRAGFGVHEVFADGARVVADDAATANVVELNELDSYVQAGVELAVEALGVLSEGKVNYGVGGEVMVPLVNDDPQDRSVGDLTNISAHARLSFKLVEWASLDIEAKALRQPQISEDWQKSIAMLLTFGYTVFEK
ncbi:MAG: hypothetical protein H6744_12805 [Deltaproteobacteria bacterium]|nr:hypothetical protein [Deltaproteobacteria bacterium]MCB9787553.1 hypothetical protein [Deltaproteobacteria bacterium]